MTTGRLPLNKILLLLSSTNTQYFLDTIAKSGPYTHNNMIGIRYCPSGYGFSPAAQGMFVEEKAEDRDGKRYHVTCDSFPVASYSLLVCR